jgi:MFS family permease
MPRSPFSFYGWRITGALAVTTTINYGVLFYVFSVLTKPMEAEFDWTRSQTSVAFSLAALTNGLTAVFTGRVVDRFGGRWLMAGGSLAGGVCLLSWSYVRTLTELYIVFAALGLVWSAVFYDVAFSVIATWFRKDRAKATFAITIVAGFASTIFYPLISRLDASLGWRETLRWLALLTVLVTGGLHVAVLRERPSVLGLVVDGAAFDEASTEPNEQSTTLAEARRTSAFWKLTAVFGIARFVATGISAHLFPLLIEQGRSPAFAASVAGAVGPMQVVGRFLFLPVSRRVSLRSLTTVTMVILGAGLLALAVSTSIISIVVFVVLFGIANGAATMNRAGLTSERFGSAAFGQISGFMGGVGAVMSVFAPAALGLGRTWSGNYVWALIGLSTFAAIGAVTMHATGEHSNESEEVSDLLNVTR